MNQKIKVKPMSVNEAYTGKRFKTKAYRNYCKIISLSIKPCKLPEPPYSVEFIFGVSNAASDWDNPIKPFQDILQNPTFQFDIHHQKYHHA